jgi:peptidoglycan/xylan/chitin deacetylase (PgdA/CDA1 family)
MLKKLALTGATLLIGLFSLAPLSAPLAKAAGTNLIQNPSLETAQDAGTPQDWLSSGWGTNTPSFSYLNTGHTGSRSVEVQVSNYTNGAANWYYNDLPVTAGTTYEYENWYKSNVDTEVDAEVVMSDGTIQYYWLGTVLASSDWAKFSTTFTAPSGAKSAAIYQLLAKNGYIISDDYSLSVYDPVPFNRGIVSVSFDDGWANQYLNALPVMQANGLVGTYNIITGSIGDTPDYMTLNQIKDVLAKGNEIGSHTITHSDLTTVSQTQLVQEMSQSQATLQSDLGVPITDFAYPYGAYNANTISVGQQYYTSQRSVDAGFNTKDNLNVTRLKIYEVDSNITQAQVKGWIDGAIADKAWLILLYHEVADTPAETDDALYTTKPTDFSAEMTYLKQTNVAVETVAQALNEVLPQVNGAPADTTPPVISNTGTTNVGTTSATVNWATDEKSTSQVNYGIGAGCGDSTALDSNLATSHSVTITGLTPNTTYHFQAVSSDASGNSAASADLTFTTAAASSVITGDLNSDGRVDALDLSTLLSNWGKTKATAGQGDLNSDQTIDALDLSSLLINWSK